MKTIIIAGCSWGAGEWSTDNQIVHYGLAKYLMDIGYNVVNLSQPGLGPFEVIRPIETFLYVNSGFLDIEHIFVLQSDIGRDLNTNGYYMRDTSQSLAELWELFRNEEHQFGLEHDLKYTYRDFYSKLNRTAEQRETKISLIGGLTDLFMEFAPQFTSLNFILPSWIQLMHPETVPIHIHEVENFPDKHKDKQQMLPLLDAANTIAKLFNTSHYFPDNCHPNKHGHKILFDYLKSLHLFSDK